MLQMIGVIKTIDMISDISLMKNQVYPFPLRSSNRAKIQVSQT
jgi:hypothetical protein